MPKSDVKRKQHNDMLALVASISALCIIAIGVLIFATQQIRARYEQQATLASENVANLLAQSISSQIVKSDIALRSIVEEAEARLKGEGIERNAINAYIGRTVALNQEIFSARIVDADGVVRYGVDRSGQAIPANSTVSVADREYFIQARAQTTHELIYTPPFIGRVIVKPVMQLVRRISAPDGSFAGVAYIAFDIESLNRIMQGVDLGRRGLSDLRMLDHTVVAHHAPASGGGDQTGKKVVIEELARAVAVNTEFGSFIAYYPGDDLVRRFSYRKVQGYPGYIVAGIALDDVMSQWWGDTLILGLVAPIFLLAGGIGLRRAQAINRSLEQRYTTALMNASRDAALLLDKDGLVLAANSELSQRFNVSADDLVGKPFFDLMPPDLARARRAACSKAIADGEPVCLTDERNGLILENVIYPVEDADGCINRVAVYSRDITQKRRTEEQIIQLKEQYQLLFSDSPDAYLIMSLEGGRVLDCNKATEILLKGERSAIIGLTPDQLSPPHQPDGRTSLESVPEKVEAVLKKGHHRFEWVHRRFDGVEFWAEVTISVSVYRGERVLFVAWRDISDRKRTEAALVESEWRFRTLVDDASDWAWETDADHRFSWLSDSFTAALGAPTSLLIGKRRWEGVFQDNETDAALWSRHMEDLAAHRRFRDFRQWMRLSDATPRWLSVSGAPRFDGNGNFLGYRGGVCDITDQADQALRLRMLSTAIEHSPISIFITDPNGRIEYVNRAFVSITGYSPEEAIGQTPRIISSGETPIEVYRGIWETISNGKQWTGELRNRHKNGERRWDAVSIAPVHNAFGQIIHFVALEEDITERRTLQESLRRTNAELEQFAYVASHDLRQPLRMITSYMGLINRQLADRMSAEQKEYMMYAIDGARRMDALIVGLLEYSRTGRSGVMEKIELNQIIEDALLNLAVNIQESSAVIDVSDHLPAIHGNRTELTRLFQNLIGNAIKYCESGKEPRVKIQYRNEGHEEVVFVADNGIGISPQDKERVFLMFQRLVSNEQYEGTGIGLAICKKIVERHEGRIWVESEVGAGATFFVALPAIRRVVN